MNEPHAPGLVVATSLEDIPTVTAAQKDLNELTAALSAVRRELGFQSASAWASTPDGWRLLEREGRVQPWHAVLDPSVLAGTPEAAEFSTVRSIPGIGGRLARLGCASLAVLPLPEGGRLLLDSAEPVASTSWIERSRPYLDLLSTLAGPDWPAEGALRGYDEMTAIQRAFTACQELLRHSDPTAAEFLESIRHAIRADEVFLLCQRSDGWDALRAPGGQRHPISEGPALNDPESSSGELSERTLRGLSLELPATSAALAGAFGREDDRPEALIAGWHRGPALSGPSMAVVARAFSTAAASMNAREHAVNKLLDRERVRIAAALHDGLTQSVTGAVLELDALHQAIERDPAIALATLENSKREIRQSLAGLRAMLFELSQTDERPPAPPEPLTAYVEDVVKRWRLPARVAVEGDLGRLPDRVLSVAYVVVREALANAAKHAAARNVTVRILAGDDDLVVVVGDGGPGFTRHDEEAAREAHHVGLDLLRRQVREAGGRLRIESQPGKGTRLIARLPINGVQR